MPTHDERVFSLHGGLTAAEMLSQFMATNAMITETVMQRQLNILTTTMQQAMNSDIAWGRNGRPHRKLMLSNRKREDSIKA